MFFEDFKIESKISEETINKYKYKVPQQVLNIWEEHGTGTVLKGYLKIIEPNSLIEVLKESYIRSEDTIPLFATSMGDIIVWERDRYLKILNFRKLKVDVISAGFDYFLEDLKDKSFLDDELQWQPYLEAMDRYGEPKFEQCFGYTPLLGIAGMEKVENIKKVKMIEHIFFNNKNNGTNCVKNKIIKNHYMG